jgi:hypothetical protein
MSQTELKQPTEALRHYEDLRVIVWKSGLAFAALFFPLAGCADQDHGSNQQAISYAPREPGSLIAPTNDLSFRMLAVDPAARLEWLGSMVRESGASCSTVTSGVLIGAFDGTDEWRVKCSGGESWALWLRPTESSVVRCTTASCM